MIGGLVAARILPTSGWHALYAVGGTAPLVLAVVLLCFLPESPRYLARRAPRWDELTGLLRRMGHSVPVGAAFDDRLEQAAENRTALKSLLGADYFRDTLALWFAFFFCLSAVYLVFGWLPAMLTGQGLDVATASSGLAAYNFGGVLGVLIWAGLVSLVGSRIPLLVGSMCGAASALALQFVSFQPGHSHALLIAGLGLHGLFVNAVQTTMYALAAHVYPTKVRASGVAAAAAVGRLGAILISLTGATIIQAGNATYLRFLAVSMMCSTIGLAAVRKHFQRSSVADTRE
jgi:AAHS family 4-hydroxybenzoate transporter-like MFS transporter